MSPCDSRSRTSVIDRRLILACQLRRMTRKIFRLLSNVNFYGVVDSKNMAGPIKKLSLTRLHNITGPVASCYKSQRLSTSLRPSNYVVLHTAIMCRFKVRPFFSWKLPSTVVRDVIILWWSFDSLHSKTVFCNASNRMKPMQASAWGHL